MRVVGPAEVKKCPRCWENYKELGGISRTDGKTEVCSPCEIAESMEEYLATLTEQRDWPLIHDRQDEFVVDSVLMRYAEERYA